VQLLGLRLKRALPDHSHLRTIRHALLAVGLSRLSTLTRRNPTYV
jgi:hypothetical protein